jgi:transposase
VDTAGQLLVTAGDNQDRLRSEAAFARLCGVAPIPVSSVRTDRHRLHRGGDRLANSALWRIALVRMHCHQPTKDYVARRTTEGKTKPEILRCAQALHRPGNLPTSSRVAAGFHVAGIDPRAVEK